MIKFHIDAEVPVPDQLIEHHHRIVLMGSCFTEHIGSALEQMKFPVLQNPNGILFDPISVVNALVSYIRNEPITAQQLFRLHELWHSWAHHSRYSGLQPDAVAAAINSSQQTAHQFLKTADWLIITLGTAYSYQLLEEDRPVANCHRAPAKWFRKHLLTIEEINTALDACLHQLRHFNPELKIILTVSPVRHVRDGLINNNRSKARLIESVHHLVEKFDKVYYFPSYELVIDVLRDHRFYDTDLVHPNYQATEYVLEQFSRHYFSAAATALAAELRSVSIARRHKPLHPGSEAHARFRREQYERISKLKQQYPYLDLEEELTWFSGEGS